MTSSGYGTAAVPEFIPAAPVDQHPPRTRRRRVRGSIARRVILAIAAIYFVGPLVIATLFTIQNHSGGITFNAYSQIFAKPPTGEIGFTTALFYSLEIAVITMLITLVLMLPTQLLLHLRFPRWRPIVEIITLLPLVFPPVVMVVGISDVYTWAAPPKTALPGQDESAIFKILRFIREDSHPILLALVYVVLAMPFCYRSLDAGIRSIDTKTMVEAGRNLGASWFSVVARILVPSLRTAIINAGFLCFALVMGEYTVSSILLYTKPFPVWLAQLPTSSGQVQSAVSVLSLLLVEALLLVIGALNWRRAAEKKG